MIQGIKRTLGRGPKGPGIPHLRLQGIIRAPNPGQPRSQSGLNLQLLERPLERIFRNKKAPAVALTVNSPGGSPAQSNILRKRIRELAEQHSKKVFVFAEDVAASGGYMLMLAGDKVYCDDTSIVGSVGVLGGGFGFVKLIENWNIERRLRTSGKYKVLNDPFAPEDPELTQRLDRHMAELHEQFRKLVREARGEKLSADRMDEIMEAGIFVGEDAVRAGLVDAVGTAHAVIRAEFGDEAYLEPVNDPRRGSPLQMFRGQFAAAAPGGVLGEAAASAVEAALDAAEDRATWARFGMRG